MGLKFSTAAPSQYYGMSQQSIINGNFDMWQKGTSFTNPAALAYIADRFQNNIVNTGTLPTTIIHSQLSLTPGDIAGSSFGYRVNTNGAGSGFGTGDLYYISQKIENGVRYLCGVGKKVTVSFWAKSDIANKRIGIRLGQNYGTGGAPTAAETLNGQNWTLTSTWTRYSLTFTTNTLVGKTFGTNKDDVLNILFFHMWGSSLASSVGASTAETFVGAGNIDIAQVQVNAGDQAIPFQPRDIDDETRKSMRYVWIPQTNSVFIRLTSYTANTLVFNVPLTNQMRVAPNIRGTINADMIAYNMSGVAQTGFTGSTSYSSDGVVVTLTKTAHGLTDAYLEIKTTSGFDAEL